MHVPQISARNGMVAVTHNCLASSTWRRIPASDCFGNLVRTSGHKPCISVGILWGGANGDPNQNPTLRPQGKRTKAEEGRRAVGQSARRKRILKPPRFHRFQFAARTKGLRATNTGATANVQFSSSTAFTWARRKLFSSGVRGSSGVA